MKINYEHGVWTGDGEPAELAKFFRELGCKAPDSPVSVSSEQVPNQGEDMGRPRQSQGEVTATPGQEPKCLQQFSAEDIPMVKEFVEKIGPGEHSFLGVLSTGPKDLAVLQRRFPRDPAWDSLRDQVSGKCRQIGLDRALVFSSSGPTQPRVYSPGPIARHIEELWSYYRGPSTEAPQTASSRSVSAAKQARRSPVKAAADKGWRDFCGRLDDRDSAALTLWLERPGLTVKETWTILSWTAFELRAVILSLTQKAKDAQINRDEAFTIERDGPKKKAKIVRYFPGRSAQKYGLDV